MVVAVPLPSPDVCRQRAAQRQRLERGPWFAALPEDLKSEILQRSTERDYLAGQLICGQGYPPEGLIAILSGQVVLSRWLTADEEVAVHLGDRGTWLGESVLSDGNSDVAVTAKTAVKGLLLPRLALRQMLAREPLWYPWFMQLLADRCRFFVEMAAEHRGLAPESRLRNRLAALADLGSPRRNGAAELVLSQCDLAALVGLSRQTTNSLLQRLATEGLVELAFRKIKIPDVEALRQESSSD